MEEPWTGELEGAKQGAEGAALVGFHLAWCPTVWTGRTGSEKRVHLSLKQPLLDGFEQLFGFLEGQTQMLNACGLLLQGNDISDGGCLAIIVTDHGG
jgi:hypothetical protein